MTARSPHARGIAVIGMLSSVPFETRREQLGAF